MERAFAGNKGEENEHLEKKDGGNKKHEKTGDTEDGVEISNGKGAGNTGTVSHMTDERDWH